MLKNSAMAILTLSLALTTPTQAQQKLYVVDKLGSTIWRMDLDGQNEECVLGDTGSGCLGEFAGFDTPWDVVLENGLMYVGDSTLNMILVATEEGANAQPLIDTWLDLPRGLSLKEGWLYWADPLEDRIERALLSDVAGTRECLIGISTDPMPGISCTWWADSEGIPFTSPSDIVPDTSLEWFYWTDTATAVRSINRARFDGTGAIDTLALPSGDQPTMITLDEVNGKLLYSDNTNDDDLIRKVNLDLTGPIEPVVPNSPPMQPGASGMTLLPGAPNDVLFFSHGGFGQIWFANKDGTNVQQLSPSFVDPFGVTITTLGAEPIPTVSEWGMLAMILMLLTAGTMVFRYRIKQQQCQPVAA